MRMVFRADASREIGAGHVMRSLALATEAINRGHICLFVGEIRDLGWVKESVEKVGFVEIFDNPLTFNSDPEIDILVLDAYHLSPRLPQLHEDFWRSIIVIGDALTPEYECDLFVHPGIDSHWITHPEKTLAGFEYVLLRPEIKIARNNKMNLDNVVNIVVSGGGGDAFGFSEAVGKVLDKLDSKFVAHFFSQTEIRSSTGKDYRNYPLGPEIDEIRKLANVAITTASTSSLEFIAAEIPTAILCTVDNQKEYFQELSAQGLAVPIGTFSRNGEWKINFEELKELINSKHKQQALKDAIIGKFDFLGAQRVIERIELIVNGSIK